MLMVVADKSALKKHIDHAISENMSFQNTSLDTSNKAFSFIPHMWPQRKHHERRTNTYKINYKLYVVFVFLSAKCFFSDSCATPVSAIRPTAVTRPS